MGKTGLNKEKDTMAGYMDFKFEIVRKKVIALPDTITVFGEECEGWIEKSSTRDAIATYMGNVLTKDQEVGWQIRFYSDDYHGQYILEWKVNGFELMGIQRDYDELIAVQDFELFIQQAVDYIESIIRNNFELEE